MSLHTRTIGRDGAIRFRGESYVLPREHAHWRNRLCRVLPLKDYGRLVLVKTFLTRTGICYARRRATITREEASRYGFLP